MRTVSALAESPSIAAGASPCTFSPPNLHSILGVVQSVHARGAAKWLQRVTGRAPRTVKYWLAGDYDPRGNDALAITSALRAELDAHSKLLRQFELDL